MPVATSGFVDLEAIDHAEWGEARRSSPARLFYSFFPADREAKERPLFVFFNGGPGYSTTGLLHAFGTGPTTLPGDVPSADIGRNPASFTQLGNLLYIDARGTGFSYGLAEDPSDQSQRELGLGAASMALRFDAADFVRVVLRLLERQPALRNNRVVWVGESYGATRAAWMTAYLWHPQQLLAGGEASEWGYTDQALAWEIEAHYAAVFPEYAFDQIGPAVAARQFGARVLIQPAYAYAVEPPVAPRDTDLDCSDGSPMRRAAEARGAACPLAFGTFDPEMFIKEMGWSEAVAGAARESMLDPVAFEQRFAVAPSRVIGLAARERTGAFRVAYPSQLVRETPDVLAEPRVWTDALGVLPEWDQYFIDNILWTTRASPDVLPLGFRLFLEQAPWIQTLITDAFWDASLPSRAIVDVVDQMATTSGLDVTARYDATPHDAEPRPGWLTLNYGASFALADRQREVRVRMPHYADSPHTVTVTQGGELLEDVTAFFYPSSAAL
jgi:hypothetical protein